MDENALLWQHAQTVVSPTAQAAYPTRELHSPQQSAGPPTALKGKGLRTLLWSISWGGVLSAVGFVALALFEQYNSCLSELRSDLKHFNEISSELVKKDNLRRLTDHVRECSKEVHATNAARAQMEHELQISEKARVDMARELQQLRERLAAVEGRQAASSIVVPLKESNRELFSAPDYWSGEPYFRHQVSVHAP